MRYILALLTGLSATLVANAPVRAAVPQSRSADTIQAAALEDWPPHYLLGENGEPAGFAVDIMEAVAERTDLAVRYVPFSTFPEAIEALRDRRVDVIPDLGVVSDRTEEFAFTRPFGAFRISVFTRSSNPAMGDSEVLAGKRVAVVRSNAAVGLLREQHPEATLVMFNSVREALFELLAAGVDAAAYPEEVFQALARSVDMGDRIRPLPEPLTEVPRGMGVAGSNTRLRDRLDRGLDDLIGSAEYERIYLGWLAPPEPFWTVDRVGWVSGIVVLVALLVMGLWRYLGMARLTARLRRSMAGREAAEEAMRKEEHRFRTLVEAAYEGILFGDADNRIAFANERAYELIGVGEEELIGASLLEYVAQEHHTRIRDGIRRRREGASDSYEIRIERPDGGSVWVLLSVAPLIDQDGTFQGSVGTMADISRLRAAEAQLRESEARFRQVAERIDDVFWITTPGKDRLEYVSPAYKDIWGRPPDELYADPDGWMDTIHPEDRERVANALPTQTDGGYEEEYRIVRPDGEVRWIWDRAFPVRDADGEVVRVVGVAEDVTERVEAEQTLRERERRFRAFVENATDLISTLGREGRMLYQSPPVRRLLGYEPEELRGKSVFEHIHPDDVPEARAAWATLVRQPGETIELPAFRFKHKDGSWRTFEATLTNLLEDPAVGAVLSNARDVTEREELERQLRRSQKLEAVGRLAGGVAHDFNNLLTVIRTNTEFLAEGHAPSNPVREHVDEIRQAAIRGADLTRQLLAFSRDQVLKPQPTQLNEVVSAMERLLRRIIGEDVLLSVDLTPSPSPIEIDPGQLEQVIMNLAVNARDAMPDGGTLEVVTAPVELDESAVRKLELEEPGSHIRLSVSDTGVGMDEATREKIFEPFFSTKAQESGTGLGLATVHGVTRQSGGAIEVESEPGAGATFHLYFPTTDKAVEPDSDTTPTVVARPLEGDQVILVVEDDPNVRRVLEKTLTRYGFGVSTAGTVAEARQALSRSSDGFDLVLTDLVLPDASGLDLVEHIEREQPATKIIAMSGYSRHEILEERILGKKIPFLGKPFTPESVASIVNRVLSEDDTG